MHTWDKNDKACSSIYEILYSLDEQRMDFEHCGALKMFQLRFSNPAESGDSIDVSASALASRIDDRLIKKYGAKYKPDSQSHAVSDILTVLLDKNKTVNDLGETNDKNYLFA
jgi:hypothetical protein